MFECEVVTKDNWNDPVLNWWRRYFGTYGENLIPRGYEKKPVVYARASVWGEGEDAYWTLAWIKTHFVMEYDHSGIAKLFEHAAVVGREPDYTWVLIPILVKEKHYLQDDGLQKQWLLFGWYKSRGQTEYVRWVDFSASPGRRLTHVTYEDLRLWAVEWMGKALVSPDRMEALPWEERKHDVWVPSSDDIEEMLNELMKEEEEDDC